MKKILLFLFLIPVFAAAQKTTGGNYTYIGQRYEWLTGIFQALGLPAGDSAQHKPGQDMRAGALYYDTLGIDAGLKIWNGLAWGNIGTGGFFSPDQTSTGNTSHDAGGFNFALNNVGDLGLNSENTNLIANSDFTISGDSVRMNSTSGRITFPNLTASDDTTTYKPMGRDAATGRLRQLSYWPGGVGGGTTLKVQRGGSGTPLWWNNTTDTALVIKDIIGETFITTGTKTDSTLYVRLDTASAGLKSYIAANSGSSSGNLQLVADYTEMIYNIAIDTVRMRTIYKIGNKYYYHAITDSIIVVTQLATPASFAALTVSDTEIDLDWEDVANESNYELQRGLLADYSDATTINSPTANVVHYSNTGLTASTTYYYRLRAVGDGVNYSNSNWTTDNATTDAPAIDSLPLNVEGGQVGFSLRKIRTGYSGSAVRVRRSSDNTEQDIGFSGADFDVAAFSSFVGGGNGFIVTWYDQGTNGYNATQATQANQPQITLSAENGHPVATFDGTDYLTIASSEGNFIYMHNTGGGVLVALKAGTVADPGANYNITGNLAGTSSKTGFFLAFNDLPSSNNGLNGIVGNSVSGQPPISRAENNIFTANQFNLLYTIFDPDNATAGNRLDHFINNGAVTVTNANSFSPVSTNATHPLQIGAGGNNLTPFVGTIAEIIFFNVIHTTATRDAVAADMDTYYDIY